MSGLGGMVEFIAEPVLLPVVGATVLLLIPRMPWCVEPRRRVAAWTAPLTVTAVTALSLHATESVGLWTFDQRWYGLLPASAIVGVVSALGRGKLVVSATAAFLAILSLQFPGHDGIAFRAMIALVAGLLSIAIRHPMNRAPALTTIALGSAMLSLATMLAVIGSMKVALLASALGATALACGTFTWFGPGFTGGTAFATSMTTMSLAIAVYGSAYRGDSDHSTASFWFVALSPLLMTVTTLSFSRSSRLGLLAGASFLCVIIVCAWSVIACVQRQEAIDHRERLPYTRADAILPRHRCAEV